jgi:hypothetical protein
LPNPVLLRVGARPSRAPDNLRHHEDPRLRSLGLEEGLRHPITRSGEDVEHSATTLGNCRAYGVDHRAGDAEPTEALIDADPTDCDQQLAPSPAAFPSEHEAAIVPVQRANEGKVRVKVEKAGNRGQIVWGTAQDSVQVPRGGSISE